MKYIRTKDGIFEKSKLIYAFNENEEYLTKEIIKQADTIEELCDEFVLIRNDKIYSNPNWQDFMDGIICPRINDKIFGAIWTDKGLIYVAKMNANGQLELL